MVFLSCDPRMRTEEYQWSSALATGDEVMVITIVRQTEYKFEETYKIQKFFFLYNYKNLQVTKTIAIQKR